MPLDRPPRPPAGAVNDAVRKAILAEAQRRGVKAPTVLALHLEGDHLADALDLLVDVTSRYQISGSDLVLRVISRMNLGVPVASVSDRFRELLLSDEAAEGFLLELPDTEFLTAIEHVLKVGFRNGTIQPQHVADLHRYAGKTLQAHGAPYQASSADWRFDWIGDARQHELVIEPALLVLADARLEGARAEFEEALRKRRNGAAKELEDAVDEAAKAVESLLQVLHDEHGVRRPRNQQISSLFNSLVVANVLPGYVDNLIAAAAGPRNHMAAHGQGGTIREVPEELAEASIAAAATAITFLAHYLP